MNQRDEHLEVLRGMWGEMKSLNARATEASARLGQAGEHLGARIDRLSDAFGDHIVRLELRQNEMEIQIVTEIVAANSTLRDLLAALRATKRAGDERGRLDLLERRIEAIEKRGA